MKQDALKNYIGKIADMESSCYSQGKAISRVSRELEKVRSNEPTRQKRPAPPALEKVEAPIKPAQPRTLNRYKLFFVLGFVAAGLATSVLMVAISNRSWSLALLMIYLAGVSAALFVLSKVFKKKDEAYAKAQEQNFNEAMEHYNNDLKKMEEKRQVAEKHLEIEMEKYTEECLAIEKKNDAIKREYETSCKEIESVKKELSDTLTKSQEVLSDLYSLDVVYPKYRNMIAMVTISEYLESGRCSTLEGPDGAYNLYELELRQNIIIDKLDTIISQLDQVKENQYKLYQKVNEANEIGAYRAVQASNIASSTRRIEAHSEITAYCAQITANNTSIIAALDMWRD